MELYPCMSPVVTYVPLSFSKNGSPLSFSANTRFNSILFSSNKASILKETESVLEHVFIIVLTEIPFLIS